MFVAHRAGCNAHWTIVERPDKRVFLDLEARAGKLLWKAPKLTSTCDRRLVVEKHAMRVSPAPAIERHRDHLAALGVVAKAGAVRHAYELVLHQRRVER